MYLDLDAGFLLPEMPLVDQNPLLFPLAIFEAEGGVIIVHDNPDFFGACDGEGWEKATEAAGYECGTQESVNGHSFTCGIRWISSNTLVYHIKKVNQIQRV
jgi:hypothetical protein